MVVVEVHVPATTANLGPGFDTLGLTLDLWNRGFFVLEGKDVQVEVRGEGADVLPSDGENLVAQAALRLFTLQGSEPSGLHICCENHIPLGSGLGSSAAACLMGLLGANALLGTPLSQAELLDLACEIEGHPDNVAPALLGGLVISTTLKTTAPDKRLEIIARQVQIPSQTVGVVLPSLDFPTKAARAVLPQQVTLQDAVANIGCTALVVEALRGGDLDLLGKVMDDRLHQPYRLPLIPGAQQAIQAARRAGAVATALSGAGPSVIAFIPSQAELIIAEMVRVFSEHGIPARSWILETTSLGCRVTVHDKVGGG